MEKKIRDVDTAMKYIILKPTKYHNEISLDYFGIQGLTLKKEDSELLQLFAKQSNQISRDKIPFEIKIEG